MLSIHPHPHDKPRKEEVLRLIMQSLNDLGYKNVVDSLQKDTGIDLEPLSVQQFRQAILEGRFGDAEQILRTLPLRQPDKPLDSAYFLIREQHFLELLEQKNTPRALHVLRQEMTPLNHDVRRLHHLSSLILCATPQEIMDQADWDGADGSSRAILLEKLEKFVDPAVMLPKARLHTLLNQAFEWQRHECLYHIANNTDFSLFYDHVCSKRHFPNHTIQILTDHTDEVWHLSFSADGSRMASISKDKTCIIWDAKKFTKLHTLYAEQAATNGAWSPNGSMLLLCGVDHCLRLWDTETGRLLRTFDQHKDQVTCCVWLADGHHFFSGAMDKSLILWNIDGKIVARHEMGRIVDMKLAMKKTPRLVTIDMDGCMTLFDMSPQGQLKEIGKLKETSKVQSMSVSRDGRYALTNSQQPDEIHLWDLDRQVLLRSYTGHEQGDFVIRSTFAGYQERYILSGSEDNDIYIWSREHQALLDVFSGHDGRVNCVAWYPSEPVMFASASDDHTIRLWGIVHEPNAEEHAALGKLQV
ncbi:WD40-repeat-containing domain protein [Gongronella butleri]|nr:WD40-repeat-containing domain protein [Gongronella butleri]